MINLWQTITRGGCVRKAWKPPSSRPILIYFEFRGKPSLITVICMNPHSPNKFQFVATKYCFLMLREDTSFLINSLFFVFFCYFTSLLIFTKIIILLSFYYIFFSWKLFFIFSCHGMFRNVPACSGKFRNVPCSGFYRLLRTLTKSPAPEKKKEKEKLYEYNYNFAILNNCRSLFWTRDAAYLSFNGQR